MKLDYQLRGFDELSKGLGELPKALRGKVFEAALLKGAKPIMEEAQARAPVRQDAGAKRIGKGSKGRLPGFLRASIRRARVREAGNQKVAVQIGPHKRAFYGMFPELGTSRQAAKPFLRPAMAAKAAEAIAATGEALRAEIVKKAEQIRDWTIRAYGRRRR